MKRPIIEINREKCNGCGLCTTACAEGALALDKEGKAVLLKEIYCDGLGACLDVCPTGALKVIQKESAPFNPKAVATHLGGGEGELPCGCPGTLAQELKKLPQTANNGSVASELSQWPIQLHLVSPAAPYFNNSELLIAADCTAFTLGSFHQDLLKGKKLVIACPKLDDTAEYVEKIASLLQNNTIYSLTTAIMTVPCCSGLYRIVKEAVKLSGKNIAVKKVVVNLDGSINRP